MKLRIVSLGFPVVIASACGAGHHGLTPLMDIVSRNDLPHDNQLKSD